MKTGSEENNQNEGFASDVIPKVSCLNQAKDSHTGVSTNSVLTAPHPSLNTPLGSAAFIAPAEKGHRSPNTDHPSWHVLRATYGREKAASQYLRTKGITTFYPTITIKKDTDGKIKKVRESMLPNLFFAYASLNELKEYVYDNSLDATRYLRFYYAKHHDGTKEPLVVPEKQMRSLMIICETESDNILIKPEEIEKFKEGQRVIITEGDFKGVEGIVARYCGQQRVGIVIEGLLTATTAYIPSAFLKKQEPKS